MGDRRPRARPRQPLRRWPGFGHRRGGLGLPRRAGAPRALVAVPLLRGSRRPPPRRAGGDRQHRPAFDHRAQRAVAFSACDARPGTAQIGGRKAAGHRGRPHLRRALLARSRGRRGAGGGDRPGRQHRPCRRAGDLRQPWPHPGGPEPSDTRHSAGRGRNRCDQRDRRRRQPDPAGAASRRRRRRDAAVHRRGATAGGRPAWADLGRAADGRRGAHQLQRAAADVPVGRLPPGAQRRLLAGSSSATRSSWSGRRAL